MPSEDSLDPDEQYTMFHPSEVELAETTQAILADVERLKPTRVVFDSLSELRLLAGNAAALPPADPGAQAVLRRRGSCTVLLLDDLTGTEHDLQVQSIAHGVVLLEQLQPRVRRASGAGCAWSSTAACSFRGGYHDYMIRTRRAGGLPAAGRGRAPAAASQPTGCRAASPALDALLGGGTRARTSTLIVGAAGTGKSTLAAQFVAPRPPSAASARRCSSSTRA